MTKRQNHTRADRLKSTGTDSLSEFRLETVLVVIGTRAQAPLVLAIGRELALSENATLHVIPTGINASSQTDMARQLEVDPEQLEGCVFHFSEDSPVEHILRLAAELPHLIIVLPAQLGAGALHKDLGPLVKEVLLQTTAPTILTPPQAHEFVWKLRRILLPHDGTPTTAATVSPAMHLAYKFMAEVVALHVAAPRRGQPSEPGTLTTPYYADQEQYEWPAWAKEFLERIRALSRDVENVKLRLLLAAGKPGPEIVSAGRACDVDLTVLAWRGTWRAERSSIIKAVVRESHRPVLVIRVSR